MTAPYSIWQRGALARVALVAAFVAAGSAGTFAWSQEVSFDFARLVEYRDVTPAQWRERAPHARLIEMKLPVSVRFQGLTVGEIEHLDFEIDGTAAGIRVESFSPMTELAADAVAIESITKTVKQRSLGATLSGKLPVPVGPISCDVGPSIAAGTSNANEATERVKRIPPRRPIVVSGTFAEGRGVFFKFKQSSQTSFEGVHELVVRFAVPVDWQAGGVRVSATARGHKPLLWMDQPTVFGKVAAVVEIYPEGSDALRQAAARRLKAAEAESQSGWDLGELFLTSGSRS